jgi:hypothetical protein
MAILVESYTQSRAAREEADERIRSTAGSLRNLDVRLLGSMFIPDDATAFYLFEGQVENVRQVMAAAGIPIDRIVEADAEPAVTCAQEA